MLVSIRLAVLFVLRGKGVGCFGLLGCCFESVWGLLRLCILCVCNFVALCFRGVDLLFWRFGCVCCFGCCWCLVGLVNSVGYSI